MCVILLIVWAHEPFARIAGASLPGGVIHIPIHSCFMLLLSFYSTMMMVLFYLYSTGMSCTVV